MLQFIDSWFLLMPLKFEQWLDCWHVVVRHLVLFVLFCHSWIVRAVEVVKDNVNLDEKFCLLIASKISNLRAPFQASFQIPIVIHQLSVSPDTKYWSNTAVLIFFPQI